MSESWLFALSPVFALAINVFTQVMAFRVWGARLGLLKSIFAGCLVGGGALLVGYVGRFFIQDTFTLDLIAELATDLLTYGALSFGYFHFINLGETARRIRLLRELASSPKGLKWEEILERYNAQAMVGVRLQRLLRSGQLKLVDGYYTIESRTLLRMAAFMALLQRQILGRSRI